MCYHVNVKFVAALVGLAIGGLLLLGIVLTAAVGGNTAAAAFSSGGTAPGGAGGIAPTSNLGAGVVSASAAHAIAYAESRIGDPYVWGGSAPGGFDCSGLVWAAYQGTPASFPRWGAADEYFQLPRLPIGAPPAPGDLVFFADSSGSIQHVGIDAGGDAQGSPVMVDAPHSGAFVRFDAFSDVPGAMWGDEHYAGATRPGG